jgi:phosphoesterase RecJ-like protein
VIDLSERTSDSTAAPVPLIVEWIRRAGTIVTITHTAPDADAIGGLLGLTHALRAMGKRATPACSDELSPRFRAMPGWADIVRSVVAPPDLLIALDCGDRERMGQIAAAPDWAGVPIVNIDHHVTNTHFGAINWVDPDAVATSEMALHLIDRLGVALTPDIASNLLHGIVGDTLGFRTPHTTPGALECAMRLMRAGANLSAIMEHQFNRRPFAMLCLWSLALQAMKLEPAIAPGGARIIWTQIDRRTRRTCGQGDWSNNGISNFLVSAEEADVAAVIVEKDDGQIDLSLRAKLGWDVSGAAQVLGGGGHPLAAGATLDGPLAAAVERVLSALREIRQP